MIYVYVGKPRNGKSLRAMMRILWTLQHTQRFVVTNMVLDLDEMQEYLDSRGLCINVRFRVRFLTTKDEMRNFWLYRHNLVLPKASDYDDKNGKSDVDYSPLFTPEFMDGPVNDPLKPATQRGTLYVIDEIHTLFPARGWQGTPRHADFYCSQHAKLNDECIFITQNTKLVDPNFYRLAQEFHYCRNHRLRKIGRFRGENKFTAHIYEGVVNSADESTPNVDEFKLDLAVARCYDTSAGVGMPGGSTADSTSARAKGFPLWLVWAGVAAAICVVYYVFNYALPQMGDKYLRHAITEGKILPTTNAKTNERSKLSTGSNAPVVSPTTNPLYSRPAALNMGPGALAASPSSLAVSPLPALPPDDAPPKPLVVTGWVRSGSRINIQLSDGRVLTERDTELGWKSTPFDLDRPRVERSSVHLADGRVLYILSSRLPIAPPPSPPDVSSPGSPQVAPRNALDDVLQSAYPPPPAAPVSSWQMHSDGVARLTPEALSNLAPKTISRVRR